MDRKEFIKKSTLACAAIGGSFSVFSLILAEHGNYQRPPGASLDGRKFLSACTRCGKCAHECPYDVIKIADYTHGKNAGTPFLSVRENPCQLCNDLPCIKACPTDALDHELTVAADTRMGTAVITDRDACLALRGIRCEACYRACPLIDKAIKIKLSHNKHTDKHAIFEPVIMKDACTGCGICVNACVLEKECIKVVNLNMEESNRYIFNYKSES